MKAIFPLDELNAFKERLSAHFEHGRIRSKKDCEDIIDEMLDLYLLALANGVNIVNLKFNTVISLPDDVVDAIINKRIDGATWRDRVWTWYATGGTEADIERIAETEAHRDGNEAACETARMAGATRKTWVTMGDEKVRDTHIYLEGVTVGIDDNFYTYDGDRAQAPGMFSTAENNCNCRCELDFE